MANALVEQLRRAQPAKTAGKSDAELTDMIARTFEARGSLAQFQESHPDFQRDLLEVRNSGGNVTAETIAAAKAGVLDRLPGTLQGAGALALDAAAGEGLAQNLGLSGALTAGGDTLRRMAAENKQEAADRIAAVGGRTIARVEDIRPTNPRDYILWALPTIAENAPSWATSLGVGAATSLVTGGAFLPGALAGGAASISQSTGDVYNTLNELGVPRSKAIKAAIATGIPMGLIDMASAILPLVKLSGVFKGAATDAIVAKLADVMGRGGIKGAAKGLVTQAITEGSTESLQELIQIAGEEYATGKVLSTEELRSRLTNAAAAGAVVGGPTGAAFGILPQAQNDSLRDSSVVERRAHYAEAAGSTPAPATTPEEPTEVPVPPPAEPEPLPPPTPDPVAVAPAPVQAAEPEPPAPADALAVDLSPLTLADIAPSRIAKTTSNDPTGDANRGGLYAIAIEKDGVVEVRNIYERKGGEQMVENSAELLPGVKVRGTGRNLKTFLANGWTVRQAPFQLAAAMPHLKLRTTPEFFDARMGALKEKSDAIVAAINEGRGDRIVEAGLKSTDPASWRAVEFLRDWIASRTGASPTHALIGLGTRVDSDATRESLRANATAKKLAAGDLLRKRNGKVFGVFDAAAWSGFKQAVADGKGDELLASHFGGENNAVSWGVAMSELGKAEQAGDPAFAGTAPTEVPIDEAPEQFTEDDERDGPLSAGTEAAVLAEYGLDGPSLDIFLATPGDLTGEDVVGRLAAPEFQTFRDGLLKRGAGRSELRTIIESIITLHGSKRKNTQDGRGTHTANAGGRAGKVLYSRPTEAVGDPERRLRDARARLADVPRTGAADRKRLRAQQADVLKRWAAERGLLLDTADFERRWKSGGEVGGAEHRVYITRDPDGQSRRVMKANDLAYHKDWQDYFDRLVLHNRLFPDTALALEGFIDTIDGLQAVTSQPFIQGARGASEAEVDAMMQKRGFKHTRRGVDFENHQVIIEDLHDENVLVTPAGELSVIDPVIMLKPGVKVEDVVGPDLFSQPADSFRATDRETSRAWSEVVAILREAGLDVAALEAAVGSVDEFYRQTGGRTDARRFIELVLKDLTSPTATDLEVATHEAVHVLFAAQPEGIRAALHRAVAKLPNPDPATNLSLATTDPEVYAQEKLAVSLQGEGVDAGTAKDMASRLVRFLKDIYYRTAQAISMALGLRSQADAFALSYFRNRLSGLLQGDYAPRSIINALGGRPLTFSERLMLLPGFGRSLGTMFEGAMRWEPKTPDTMEALAHNLDVAFSRPPLSESEANVRKGIDALNRVLEDHSVQVRGAMYRAEVGSITFEWGNPGDAAKAFRGGFGIGHILARRSLVGGMNPPEVLASLVETIAYGDASAPYGGEGDTRIRIDDGTNTVILSLGRHGKRETWVVTSFDNTRGKNSASVTGAQAKDVPSERAAQDVRAFSPDDLVAVTDRLKLAARLRVVKDDRLYSRPIQTAIGAIDNPANAINRDVATLNHMIAAERVALAQVIASPGLTSIIQAANNGALDIARWFRAQFRFEDPNALKATALARLDPVTQQPVQGVNPGHTFADFADDTNAGPARIHAHQAAWRRVKAMSGQLTKDRADLVRAQNRHTATQKAFVEAHRNYLNAEGLTSLVLRGVRQLVSRERKLGLRTGQQAGIVMQQLRQLDDRSARTIDREYASVFAKLFQGQELSGRNLFDLLDQLVNEMAIDFRGLKIVEIRQKIAERVASGIGSSELGLLINATPSSRALLATVVAYGKAHPDVLAQIERRRLKNITERMELQEKLTALMAERDITNQAVTDLPKTAKLEERARILYVQAKRRDRAMVEDVRALEHRISAAEAALPVYQKVVEQLQRELGGVRPDYTFGDGMVYRVPVNGVLEPRTLKLDSTQQVTDRAQLDQDLAAMSQWIAMKESNGELDADYRDVRAARHAILEGGYFESDIRKTDLWVRGNVFLPVGARAEATGLPSGRLLGQMFNRFAATENELRAQSQKKGDRNNRLRDAAITVLNRGRKDKDMTADRYYAEIAEPAISILEKSRDLLELPLSNEQRMGRAMQRVINHLLSNPSTEPFVRGREADVAAALRAHIEALQETSKFFNDVNARNGLGVQDERLVVVRGDGVETMGIRDSLPVGLVTVSSRLSSVAGRVYRLMSAAKWGAFKEAIATAEADYAQSPDALRQKLAPFFADPSIVEDFVGAMATTDTYSAFDAPVLSDGVTRPEADPARVAAAWRSSGGDVVKFIEQMYAAHGGTAGVGQYAGDVLGRMSEYWTELGSMLDPAESGMAPDGLSRLSSNLMIDARTLDRWPTAWREYLFFDPHTNHALARRTAAQIAFGRNTDRLAEVWAGLEKEMDAIRASHEAVVAREQRNGFTGKKLRARVEADYVNRLGAGGKAEYARVERLVKLRPIIAESRESIRLFFSSKHNQLDATRFAAHLGQTVAFGMLNNPGTALINLADLFAPVAQGGVSGTTLKQVLNNWKFLGEGLAGSVAQAIGLDLMTSSRLQGLYVSEGYSDPAVAMQYIGRTEDGFHSDITADHAARGREETPGSYALRVFQRTLSFGITPKGEQSRFTALRPFAPFAQFVQETMRASTLSTWSRVEDMVARGLAHFDNNPSDARDPNFKLTAAALGMDGAEATAFDALRIRLAEGYGLELTDLARVAAKRMAGKTDRNLLLDRTSRALIQGMVASELILEGNLATMTPKAWTSAFARFVLPLWGWPIRRALQVARIGLDTQERFRLEALARGMTALGVMAGAGLAMSLLADEYHEKIVGRKRNLRSVASLPAHLQQGEVGQAFLTLMENVNRAGTFGVWGEILNLANAAAGEGDNRSLSFDRRVVMMNSLLTLSKSLANTFAQGDIDYSGVVRPTIMALGGNSALQFLQVGNNALGLDNLESRFVERVDAQNRLRVAGRELGLEVRTGMSVSVVPTSLTPVVSRMVLAAYAGDRGDFLKAWRSAVQEAREMGKDDPVAYVRDSFASRHPLKNVFRTVSNDDYVKLLRHLDDSGRREVKGAVDRFNAYIESLDGRAFVGTVKREARVSSDLGGTRLGLLGFGR